MSGGVFISYARSFIARIELEGKISVLLNGNPNQSIDVASPSPDGHHLAFSQRTAESNAWLLENF